MHRPVTPRQGMSLRDEGGSSIRIRVFIDAMSIFSALAVDRVKPPAEKSLFCRLLRLKVPSWPGEWRRHRFSCESEICEAESLDTRWNTSPKPAPRHRRDLDVCAGCHLCWTRQGALLLPRGARFARG